MTQQHQPTISNIPVEQQQLHQKTNSQEGDHTQQVVGKILDNSATLTSLTNDDDYIVIDICESCSKIQEDDFDTSVECCCSSTNTTTVNKASSVASSSINLSERKSVIKTREKHQLQKRQSSIETVQKHETTIVKQPDIILFNTPKQVLEKFKTDGIRKSKLTFDQMTILGLFAGIFIGLACALGLVVGGNVPNIEKDNPGLQKLLTGVVFPLGLILIVMTGSELFTGNVLVVLIGLFSRRWRSKKFLIQYALFSKNILFSYVFNCIGSFMFAYFFMYLPQPCCSAYWISYVQTIAESKVKKAFGSLVLLGIMCNVLITIAVWCSAAATTLSGKFLGIWFPILAFSCLGYEQSIANAFYIPLAMLYGANITVYDFLISNMIPVTIGNIIGGAVINGCLMYYVHDFRVRKPKVLFSWFKKLWKRLTKKNNEMLPTTTPSKSIEMISSVSVVNGMK